MNNDLPIDVLVNKDNLLDSSYVPSNLYVVDENENNYLGYLNPNLKPTLRSDLKKYLDEMQKAASFYSADFIVNSGYRSYKYQLEILNRFLNKMGDYAYKVCALPGASEHQTGLAIDVSSIKDGVYNPNTSESDEVIKWLIDNSYYYGFILRYPKGKESITGINYEYWHYRFVGLDLAKYLYKNNLTLEEYYSNEKRILKR